MLPYRITCSNCGTPRIARKRSPDGEILPYKMTCPDCGAKTFDIDGKMRMTEQGVTSDGTLETALQEQKQRVLAELDEEKTLDATPIIQHENLNCEEYLTLVYELHHVHLPELQSNELVVFDRQEDEVTRGPQFKKKRPSLKSGDKS